MDYDFAILDLSDDAEPAVARLRGWVGAVLRGFRDPRPDDELVERGIGHYRTDRVTVRGAWLPDAELGSGPMPVATYASLDKTLNAGRELLPLRMVTDVTTSPAHRRRGLLRRMIEADLADAVEQRIPVAALTASEATIYGRWGFGPATFQHGVEVDTSPGFAFRSFVDPGRVELLEPADAWPHVEAVFTAFHARQRGSVEWPTQYEDMHSGAYDFNGSGSNRRIRTAVHVGDDGRVDGFAIYKHGEKDSVNVEEMAALTTEAQLGLWSFLAGLDRVRTVSFGMFHPQDPLMWALSDLNRVRTTALREFLWLRVLDVPRALAARPWAADGTVVLEVDDPQGHAAGTFEVTSAAGVATVVPSEGAGEVRVTAETLGSLFLGTVPVPQLRRAGRVEGTDEAVRRFAAMTDLDEQPYNLTGF
ncbi:GNAT family N-acetyltransferase [Nocardioides sp. zg-1228]|uniref:GNAT family N-acetyltransferase n=1 Tax=Nocardioides sp. zg-1228 TaxID=2763008 RepID=UPI0016436AB4|nr:GNAT family N-acetyltransferase [Nocardioides sp. zg-1228]MBC2932672.1 GNAT family N-acetyltransferase [Nocardioides sp. zg-1228]QSF58154.1 GNAT family N-acetyltransferase [Nocardioides sp. zg-1228]